MSSFGNIEPIIEELVGKEKGYFVDIGAHDGISGNNTIYFEKKGWEGVCIEPHPKVFPLLQRSRNCQLENCAVWQSDTDVMFLAVTGYAEMLSGIMESYDPRHYQRIQREVAGMGGSTELVKIPARKFSSIVTQKDIDFLSIDTEGSEMNILRNVDFNEYDIRVICIENNFMDPAYEEFFRERGYTLHSTHLGCDQIYVKNT